jgi:HAD superfamily hydrolase (TIGR01490 family)
VASRGGSGDADRILAPVGRPAAFFDLDKTIIATSSTFAFGRPFLHNGLINRRVVLRGAYAQLVYLIAGADAHQMDRMRDYVTTLCVGWDVQQVRDIVREALHDVVRPLVYAEARELIDQHRMSGHDVIIVSSGGEEVVCPIGEMLGVDGVIATRMVVENGRYTGAVAFYAYGENKALAIRELAAERGYDLAASFAYSDSVTDLPLLEAVGNPTAVNPDRALRRIAVERGWETVTFHRPVSLRTRFADLRVPVSPVLTAAVCVGTLCAGLTWYVTRRRGVAA